MEGPYNPGSGLMPPLLAGRAPQFNRAEQVLGRVHHFGTPATPMVLTGPRRLGKTVTLRMLADRARSRGFVAAYVTLDRGSSTPQRLAAAMAESLAPSADRGGERWQRWRERLGSLSVEVSVAGLVKIGGRVDRAGLDPALNRDTLTALIGEAAAIATDKGCSGLALFIDELQEAPESDLVILANAIQDNLSTGTAALAIFGAGLPQTPDRLMSAASFAERFTYQVLGRLSDDEAGTALLQPAADAQVRWEEAAAETVLSHAKGSPYLIQLFGRGAWTQAQPGPGGTIRAADAAAGTAAAEADLWNGMFRGRWNKATAAERELLAAVAATLGQDDTSTTADVTTLLGKTSPQISTLRVRLIDKGILEAPSYGRLGFTMPGFEEFVLAETGMGTAGPAGPAGNR